jgi:Holliday junction resolvasome RuvABC DNA-binding subunit
MIGRLTGLLAEKNPPQIVLDVNGVGYEIDVPMSTFYNLPTSGEKGIGKKTAERLLLELKGKLAETTGVSLNATVHDAKSDISNALLSLGYNEKEAASAMRLLPTDVSTSDGIRQALKLLSKG